VEVAVLLFQHVTLFADFLNFPVYVIGTFQVVDFGVAEAFGDGIVFKHNHAI
jgi:hypothetical protein